MAFHLEFEGIRCFRRKQRVRIAPLTLLVGENSSGKSTVLAVTKIAMDMATCRLRPEPFNDPPFILGAWDDIAYRSRSGKRATSFRIGLTGESDPEFTLESEWSSRQGHPWKKRDIMMHIGGESEVWLGDNDEEMSPVYDPNYNYNAWADLGDWIDSCGETIAIAPIRSSPRRTYDPVIPVQHPEGAHTPHVLASAWASRGEELKRFQAGLIEFGKDAGMFDSIHVERKGNKRSDPFQIRVLTRNADVNLIDVGYGVSQVLPILVDTLMKRTASPLLLLQQPEVHLHPQAQAALGSFFARSVKSGAARFMIETHSDYLIDRVRVAVREGIVSTQDVSLLYFEKKGSEATIHEIALDGAGQITDPPIGYRQFFSDEASRVLGID